MHAAISQWCWCCKKKEKKRAKVLQVDKAETGRDEATKNKGWDDGDEAIDADTGHELAIAA